MKLNQAILDNIPSAVVVIDAQGQYLRFNAAAERLYGPWVLGVGPGPGGLAVFLADGVTPCPPDLYPHARALRGETTEGEFYLRRPDGSGTLVSVYVSPLPDEDGTLGALIIATDITQRKQGEMALKTSEAHLREAQRLARVGSWEWDYISDTVTWTEEVYAMFGLDPRGPPPGIAEHGKIYTPESLAALAAAVKRAIADGTPYELDLETRRADGGQGWMATKGEAVRDAGGRITGLRGAVMDITERKRKENQIAELADRLAVATRAGQIGIWELDIATDRLIWDDTTYELYGRMRAADRTLPNDAWISALHPDDRDRTLACERESLASGSRFDAEFRIVKPDGATRHMRAHALIHRDETGAPQRMIGANWDITELRTLNQALEEEQERLLRVIDDWIVAKTEADQANRAKSEFLAVMSHELKTPMNAILGFGQMLESGIFGQLNLKQREFTAAILSSASHLNTLIDQVLTMSQIEAGRMTVSVETLALPPIIDRVMATLGGINAAKGVALRQSGFDRDVAMVEADRLWLSQALINLGSNAIKYNRPDGSVLLSRQDLEDGRIRVMVTDTGIGIPEARQAELFQPFNRLGAERLGIEGAGIGLVITRRVVELMGGELGFTSTPGVGSSFWIDLRVPKGGSIAAAPPSVRAQPD